MADNSTKRTNRKPKWKLLHQYYSYTGFYRFVAKSCLKAALPIALFVGALFYIHFFVMDINAMLTYATENYPPIGVFLIFFASEAILGLIPPEIFIAWAGHSVSPIGFLAILATLSYLGGVFSYFTGRGIANLPAVYRYLQGKMQKHIKNMRKWGGFLIIVGALLPLPFAISSLAAGIIKFRVKTYLLVGLLRFVRFAIYGYLIFTGLKG